MNNWFPYLMFHVVTDRVVFDRHFFYHNGMENGVPGELDEEGTYALIGILV